MPLSQLSATDALGGRLEEALSRCTSPHRAADNDVAVVFLAFVQWARCNPLSQCSAEGSS